MRFYLVRHGMPVRGGAYSDLDRPLTAAGESQLETLEHTLAWLGVGTAHIATSPAERCRSSAAILAHELHLPASHLHTLPELGIDGNPARALAAIGARAGVGWIVVTHEPIVRGMCAALLGGPPRVGLRFDRGACACFDLEATTVKPPALLEWLLSPELLSKRVAAN